MKKFILLILFVLAASPALADRKISANAPRNAISVIDAAQLKSVEGGYSYGHAMLLCVDGSKILVIEEGSNLTTQPIPGPCSAHKDANPFMPPAEEPLKGPISSAPTQTYPPTNGVNW